MKYVSVAKLQNKLDGQANQTVVRRLINKMTQDGFLEAKGNRRLGMCFHLSKACAPHDFAGLIPGKFTLSSIHC